jgi:hypothetical protein
MQEVSEVISSPGLAIDYQKPSQAIIRDSQATLRSQGSVPQIAPFSSQIDRQTLISSWVSLRLDLVNEQLSQTDPATSFYKLIAAGTQAYGNEFLDYKHPQSFSPVITSAR